MTLTEPRRRGSASGSSAGPERPKRTSSRTVCPSCGGRDFTPLGAGAITELYELVPAMVERQLHIQEKLRCRCGEGIVTADGPEKVYDKARFGPTFMAQVEFKVWLDAERPRHPPRGPMGEAITYALGQWNALTLFLIDPHLPVDNNASERALRVAALGRKNFLFVGHDEAGENLAGLYSLIATCEANDVNPVAYLADVLLRRWTQESGVADASMARQMTFASRLPAGVAVRADSRRLWSRDEERT